MPISPTLFAAIAVDLVAVAILAGPLYFRRHRRRDLMLSYVALNVGVLGVALALSGAQVGVGLGLGLFGVLSIVRLRSDQISQAEIAYYFTALALGLLSGIGASSVWMPAVFSALLLAVLYVADHPRLLSAQRRRVVTLDRAYLDEAGLRTALTDLLGGRVTRMEIMETDLVRDTTVVDVRYRVSHARTATPALQQPVAQQPTPEQPVAQQSLAQQPGNGWSTGAQQAARAQEVGGAVPFPAPPRNGRAPWPAAEDLPAAPVAGSGWRR